MSDILGIHVCKDGKQYLKAAKHNGRRLLLLHGMSTCVIDTTIFIEVSVAELVKLLYLRFFVRPFDSPCSCVRIWTIHFLFCSDLF